MLLRTTEAIAEALAQEDGLSEESEDLISRAGDLDDLTTWIGNELSEGKHTWGSCQQLD